VDDLALQIGQLHHVVVAQGERAHAGRGQIHGHRRAQAARANHQDVAVQQAGLAGDVYLGQQDMAAVAQQLLVVHGGESGR
jgi:hypothetical protein